MKNLFKATALMALMCGVALAQNASPSPNSGTPQPQAQPSTPQNSAQSATPGQHPTRIAPGSVIPVQLTKTVDAKKAKTGDEVVAKVTMDMKTQSGDVLVPKDTKVIGHVTEAQKREKDQKQSELGLAFDRAVTKDGNTMQMPMSIQAVIGQQHRTSRVKRILRQEKSKRPECLPGQRQPARRQPAPPERRRRSSESLCDSGVCRRRNRLCRCRCPAR